MDSAPTSPTSPTSPTRQAEEQDATVKRIIGMFARRVQDRRMEILGLFEDHANTKWAGPGHVTVNQFARAIDLLGFRLNRQEMTALCNVYCDTDKKNEFNFLIFCAEVDPNYSGRSGRGGEIDAFSKPKDAAKGNPALSKVPGNPYFDQFGQVKPLIPPTKVLSARTPRKDAAMLRHGFQPVGAQIVNDPGSPVHVAARPWTPYADKPVDFRALDQAPPNGAGGVVKAGGQAFAFDHGHLVGVSAPGVEDDLTRIQAQIFRRRIRTKEFFKHWDKQNTGRITREQFSRAIANIIHPNTFCDAESPIDIKELSDFFVDSAAKEPGVVSYIKFCEVMDSVFNKPGLENRPGTSVPKPGHCVMDAGGFEPRPVRDEQSLKQLLRRVSYLVEVHGVNLSTCFNDCQRTDADVRTGRISADSFIRHFPLAKSTPSKPAFLKRPDMELLLQRYTDDNGWVRLFAFQGDIEDIQQKKPQLVARLTPSTSAIVSDHNSVTTIVGKLGL